MNDLLAFAVEAHGGLARWDAFSPTACRALGRWRHLAHQAAAGLLQNKVFEIDTHAERLSITPFATPTRRSVFVPGRLTLETFDGEVCEMRNDPEAAFEGQARETPWDKLHVAYFASEALWTYLTSPFLYTYPGFVSREIEPWHENGETWRRLEVTFPDYIKSHTRTQVTHFGPDGLMRRHDYTVDILGGATGANYTADYRTFQGIKMPTRRRIFAYDETMRKVPDRLLVSLDFGKLSFS